MVKNVFILDEHLKTDKVLTVNGKNAFFDDLYTLDLSTGTETYEFSTTITEINESNYVMFYYHGKYKLFQIVEIEQEHAEGDIVTTVYAETACLELLNNVVRSFEGEYNAISFLEHVLEGSEWAIGEYSSSLAEKVVSVKVDKTTQKWSCIQDYMGNFGYEISPRVIYDNGHVKAKLIDVYSEGGLGDHTYKRFEYGYNVTGMVKKKDLYEWCTALIIDTDKDVTSVTYNEKGYVKEANSDVVLATNENRKYNLGRDYIYGNFDANGCNDGTDAVAKAVEELKRRATPRFDYECTTALTYDEYDNLNLGDTVYCIDHTFLPSLTLEARVGKLELSFSDRTKCKCTLTNYKEVKSKINMELTGTIQQIVGSYFPITSDGIANGAITDGKIETTYYQQITADIVSASKVVTEELIAKKIIAIDAKFENLETIYAKIENLNATNANITNLNATVATIQTLINGNLTSDNIQSLVLTSDKVTIADALIKDANIESVNASKVNTGTLNTNNVSVQSNDGSMLLQGNLQQFKDKDGNVRIQIGKDATGNFTFSLFDAGGTGVLIDETGIKSGAIANGLIVNAMVSDTANISGSKLDISSVISSINANENTLLSSKIKFSDTDQTLDVAFNQLKTKVETIENVTIDGDLSSVIEQVNTNTTNIGVAQGQISSLISNTTITKQDGTVTQLKDEYMSTQQTVNGLTTKVGSLETNYKGTLKSSSPQYYVSTSSTSLSEGSWSDSSPSWAAGKYIWQRMKYTYTDNSIKYSTAVCIQGAKGDTGEKGQSLIKSTPQWYLSTSNTTQTGGSWSETMPTVTSGKYVWLRYKLDWQNPTATTYTTPTLEQVAESVKEVISKQATLEQNLDGFKTTVSSTYATKDEMNTKQAELEQSLNGFKTTVSNTYTTKDEMSTTQRELSQVTQTADKINWLVSSGTSKSDMTLTDELFNLVANNITLTAEHIKLEGLVTANKYFQILTDGSCKAQDIIVNNDISAGNLIAKKLSVPGYDKCLTKTVNIYITPEYIYGTELDKSYFNDEVVFRSFNDLFSVAPRNLNGYTLNIYITADITEKVNCDNFNNGIVTVNLQGHSLKGYIRFSGPGLRAYVYGDKSGSTGGTTRGSIVPGAVGNVYGDYRYGMQCDDASLTVYDVDFYSGTATDMPTNGIACSNGCRAYLSDIKAVNGPNTLVRADTCSHVYVENSSGVCSSYSFQSMSGSIVILNGITQCGTSGPANAYYRSNNSQIYTNEVTWNSVTISGSETNPDTGGGSTITTIISSSEGNSWRESGLYANSWSDDGVVRQGQWDSDSGLNIGCWFFGNDIYNILQNDRNKIKSMKVKITRNSGGQNIETLHLLRAHTMANKPIGAPDILLDNNSLSQASYLYVGNSTTFSLNDDEIYYLRAQKAKGFALYINSTDANSYTCCSPDMTVTITYTTS